jgi:hypothetical protein
VRPWLVLAICTLAAPARAEQLRTCDPTPSVLPRDGATDVPVNTNVWIFGGQHHGYELRDRRGKHRLGTAVWSRPFMTQLDLRERIDRTSHLANNHAYTVLRDGEPMIAFTTGHEIDKTPPNAPRISDVSVESGRLRVRAMPSADSVATWVTLKREGQRQATGWQLFPSADFDAAFETCSQLQVPAAPSMCVELRSLDLAGNLSAIASRCIALAGGHRAPSSEAQSSQLSRDIWRNVLFLALALGMGVLLIAVRSWLARRRLGAATITSLNPIGVLFHARKQRLRFTLIAVGCAAAALIVLTSPAGTFPEWISMPSIALATYAGASVWRAHRVIGLLSAGSAEPITDGEDFVFVVDNGKLASFLEVRRAALPGSNPISLPRATARRMH